MRILSGKIKYIILGVISLSCVGLFIILTQTTNKDVSEQTVKDKGMIKLQQVYNEYNDDPYVNLISMSETEKASEEVSEEIQTEKPTQLIEVKKLNISSKDLSIKEEIQQDIQIVNSPDEKVELPSNEISKLVYGIDVSKWQGNIDWAKVKADGIEFAMIKMGGRSTGYSGELYVDSYFEKNIQGAIANGIQVGVYFFSQAVTEKEALEEASMIIEYIKKYKITYPVAFDWESASGYRVNDYYLNKSQLTKITSVFCDTVASYGYTPMVYFNRSDWYNAVNGPELTSKYKSWLAVYFGEYYNNPDARNWYNAQSQELPNFKYSYQMWQYTSRGHVAGINGSVDLNIAFFTYVNYKVDIKPITLNITNTNITTNIGTNVDLMVGVTATNSIGYDATGNISLAIIDGDGSDVSNDMNYVFTHAGKYKLVYVFNDPTGQKKEVNASLTVRDIPTITVKENNLALTYNTSISDKLNFENLINALNTNVMTKSFEGISLDVKITGIESSLLAGTYTVVYNVDDGLGLTNVAEITVTIIRNELTQ